MTTVFSRFLLRFLSIFVCTVLCKKGWSTIAISGKWYCFCRTLTEAIPMAAIVCGGVALHTFVKVTISDPCEKLEMPNKYCQAQCNAMLQVASWGISTLRNGWG